FITSTVRTNMQLPFLDADVAAEKVLKPTTMSLYGVRRIIEVVAAGKDVDLFTVMRATGRVLKYRTCLLQWRRGRLDHIYTVDDLARPRKLKEKRDRVYNS